MGQPPQTTENDYSKHNGTLDNHHKQLKMITVNTLGQPPQPTENDYSKQTGTTTTNNKKGLQ